MTALESALTELRECATDGTTADLLFDECAALRAYIGRLHAAVIAAEQRPEGWSATVAEAATEIRALESEH